jgi:TetR/AcrR family transcriptional regulator
MKKTTKQTLLSVAIELFAEYGYDKVSIRDIAEKAKTNSSMISYYFVSKQNLYDAALEKQAGNLQTFLSSSTAALSPQKILQLYADTLQEIHEKNPTLMKFICWEFKTPSAHPETFIKQRLQKVYCLISQAIRRGINDGSFREDLDVYSTAVVLAGIVNFYYISRELRNRISNAEDNDEEYMKQAMKIFFDGIARKQP